MHDFVKHLGESLHKKVSNFIPVSGGDINQAFKLVFSDGAAFLKCNTLEHGLEMLRAEHHGLNSIASTSTLQTPNVLAVGHFEEWSFLVLEYVESESPSSAFWQVFGRQLAKLHKTTQIQFGYDRDNFIGELLQINSHQATWVDFFVYCRIEPQLKLARDNNLMAQSDLSLFDFLKYSGENIFPLEKPSLLHGDLWSGNFLVRSECPVLIDPACYFGHREMDLAMTHLFGGSLPAFYDAYSNEYPLSDGLHDRLKIYQLYPLLVHLNHFGRSYLPAIYQIVRQYS